jgi:purine-binding chemotaxis protein CheW
MSKKVTEILCFSMDEQRFAIPLDSVERVLRAQAVTAVPDSPEYIYGIIDYHGEVIAVINLRKRFNLLCRPVRLNDRFIIAGTPSRKLALSVDEVEGVLIPDDKDLYEVKQVFPETDTGLKLIRILREDTGIILIYDMEKFLSGDEEIRLQEIIEMQTKAKQ